MDAPIQDHRDYGFIVGLLAGTFVGAGLMMWLAPRMRSEVRQRMTDSARTLGQRASKQYQQATGRVAEVVDELAQKGHAVRHDVADAVVRGAQKVERYATAAKGDRGTDASEHPAADRTISPAHSG